MMAERREKEDVYYRGVLLYKPGAWASSQQYTARLKFESVSGMKRLELYPPHGNKRMPGSPSQCILLTHALGVTDCRQYAISRTKHAFQIMGPGERHQLCARSEEEKAEWIIKLNNIINNMPLDNRTHEFHVSISPTTLSDKLHLNGQYILKVTETEIHLFSASGAIPSKFWCPLGGIRTASHYVIPASGAPARQFGMRKRGAMRDTTQRLLVITTESTAPIGDGGFAFFAASAKDIAETITHRRERRIQTRATTITAPRTEHVTTRPAPLLSTSQKKRLQKRQSLPTGSSTETDDTDDLRGGARPGDGTDNLRGGARPGNSGETVKKRGSHLYRRCEHTCRVIPMSHRIEKSKSQLHIQLSDPKISTDRSITPEDTLFVTNRDLASTQEKFREWKKQREDGACPETLLNGDQGRRRERSSTISSPERPQGSCMSSPSSVGPETLLGGRQRRRQWARGRSSTITSPEIEGRCMSSASSVDGEYVTICRMSFGGEDDSESVSSETSSGRMKGIERQNEIDVSSPMGESEQRGFICIRPRTNAFSETENDLLPPVSGQLSPPLPPSPAPRRQAMICKQQSLVGTQGDKGRVWQCNEDTCMLAPRPPNLATIPQKSGSDPQLSTRLSSELTDSHEYLKILPTKPKPIKKPIKKPKPLPRAHKQLPESLPLYENTFNMTPPTPTSPEKPCKPRAPTPPDLNQLDVKTLFSTQRSLSESNLYTNLPGGGGGGGGLGERQETDDDYVEMMPYIRHPPLYVNCSEAGILSSPQVHPGVTLRPSAEVATRRMLRQTSHSAGDLPAPLGSSFPLYVNEMPCVGSFLDTEQLYANGQFIMEWCLYGNTSDEQVSSGIHSGSHGNATEPGRYGDSGLGSTPSCSPLVASRSRSFSLDNVRNASTVFPTQKMTHHNLQIVNPAASVPTEWQSPHCTKPCRRSQTEGCSQNNQYENYPLITSS